MKATRRQRYRIVLLAALAAFATVDVGAIECFTPDRWQPKLTGTPFDGDGNFVEDTIDELPPTDIIDVILALNRCPEAEDKLRLQQFGTLDFVSKYISYVVLTGVVVNDSLVMVDFINKARQAGVPLKQAVIDSGTQRFRAIILTSFTTAAGLTPIMLETSVQAQYMIPMAISLSFGIVFATVITLFLIPSLYMLQLDGFARSRAIIDWFFDRQRPGDASETA